MKDTPVLLFLATFLFALLPFMTADVPPPSTDDSDFIRNSCNATSYPDVCFASLSSYAGSVQKDPARLACVAILVTLSKTRELASYLTNVSRANEDPGAAGALKDCLSNMKDAVGEMGDSLKQMRELKQTGSVEWFKFQMSNVQTWMSAALTDQETCTDGLEGVRDDEPVKADLRQQVDDVKKLTSNALALVNCYANNCVVH